MQPSVESRSEPHQKAAWAEYAEKHPEESAWILLSALDQSHTASLIFDRDLRVYHVTPLAAELLGLTWDTSLGRPELWSLLQRSALTPDSIETAKSLTAALPDEIEPISVNLSCLDDSKSQLLRLSLFNIGHSFVGAHLEEQQEELLDRDVVTGLANRRSFERILKESIAARPADCQLPVLLLDLDRFKTVNDTLGHVAGDTLLNRVGERLKGAVRKFDIVARVGGDEFAILLAPGTTREQTEAVSARLLDLIQRTYVIDGQLANVGVSIGIASVPSDGTDSGEILQAADLALYAAKEAGRARHRFYDSSLKRAADSRRANELDLRRALALRQFELFYQPQVNSSGQLLGFEALIRWRHPERGLVPPNDFLAAAERMGLIVSIGEWALRTACKEALKWADSVVVAVNVSPLQIQGGEFAKTVRSALKVSGLPGHRLELEITEGMLLGNTDVVMDTLRELRTMNVRIAMDDFGTGYASLSQLATFPFDKIKIDRSLAGFEGNDVKKRAIVRAITSLGESLGICTLAEGVETAQQLDRLHRDGCSSVQGYLYSRPVPASSLPDLIRELEEKRGQSSDPS